jgi:hypothetical protein
MEKNILDHFKFRIIQKKSTRTISRLFVYHFCVNFKVMSSQFTRSNNNNKRRKRDDDEESYVMNPQEDEQDNDDDNDDDGEEEEEEEEQELEGQENINPNIIMTDGNNDDDGYDANKDNWLFYCRFKKDGCNHSGFKNNGLAIRKHEETCPVRKNRALPNKRRHKEAPTLQDLTKHSRYGAGRKYSSKKSLSKQHRHHRHKHRHHHHRQQEQQAIVGLNEALICYQAPVSSPQQEGVTTRNNRYHQRQLLLPPSSSSEIPIDPREYECNISYLPSNPSSSASNNQRFTALPTLTYTNTESPDFLHTGTAPLPTLDNITPPVRVREFIHITLPTSPFQNNNNNGTNEEEGISSFNDDRVRRQIHWNQKIITENCTRMQCLTESCSLLFTELTTTLMGQTAQSVA